MLGMKSLATMPLTALWLGEFVLRISPIEGRPSKLAHLVDQFLGILDQLAAEEVVLRRRVQLLQQSQGLFVDRRMVSDYGSRELVNLRIGRNRQRQMCVADVDIVSGIRDMRDLKVVEVCGRFRRAASHRCGAAGHADNGKDTRNNEGF